MDKFEHEVERAIRCHVVHDAVAGGIGGQANVEFVLRACFDLVEIERACRRSRKHQSEERASGSRHGHLSTPTCAGRARKANR